MSKPACRKSEHSLLVAGLERAHELRHRDRNVEALELGDRALVVPGVVRAAVVLSGASCGVGTHRAVEVVGHAQIDDLGARPRAGNRAGSAVSRPSAR
jgi:hypothetical protein